MKHINIFIMVAICMFTVNMANSQSMKAKMTFNNVKHNFGKVKESGGSVSYKYVFTNTGAEPIVIEKVKSSCGCTTPDWTRGPVAPGAKGFVSASYNPLHRPGKFNKTIRITSNAENSPVVLYVSGEVVKEKKKISEIYKQKMGVVRLTTKNIHFGDIKKTQNIKTVENDNSLSGMIKSVSKKAKYTKIIDIINTGKKDAKITFRISKRDKQVEVKAVPDILKPNQEGKIIITYNPKNVKDWGYVRNNVYMVVNKKNNSGNRLYISARIVEGFTKEQLANPPKMEFIDPMTYDFGTIKQKDVIEHIFRFTNTGKSDLIIRKTKASCGCTAIAPKDKIIHPGQESQIKAIFNSRGKRNHQTKTITIITNIPGKTKGAPNSRVILKLVGNVTVPPKNK